MGKTGRITLDLESGSLVHFQRPSLKPTAVWSSTISQAAQITGSLLNNTLKQIFCGRPNSHAVVLKQFVQSLQGKGPSPVTAEEALEAVRILEQLDHQLRGSG